MDPQHLQMLMRNIYLVNARDLRVGPGAAFFFWQPPFTETPSPWQEGIDKYILRRLKRSVKRNRRQPVYIRVASDPM